MDKSYLITNQDKDCFNCELCQEVCPFNSIEKKDRSAFFYPYKNSKCTDCKVCEKFCPSHKNKVNEFEQKFYGLWNKKDDVILKSSSGGAFTSLAMFVLDKNGAVYGAAFNEHMVVEHKRVTDLNELDCLRGSKYVKSSIKNSFKLVKKDLDDDKYVLFSGTPCQIAAIRAYLRKDYEKLYCVDLVCHGTPTPVAFKKYQEYLEETNQSKLTEIKFRLKKDSEKSYFYAKFVNGLEIIEPFTPETNKYAKVFYSNIALSPACTECQFNNLNRPGDVTIGDFWGIEKCEGVQKNHLGNSLLIVNNEKGKELLENIREYCDYKEVDKEIAVKGNPPLYTHTIEHPLSKLYKKMILKHNFNKTYMWIVVIGSKVMLPYRIVRKVIKKLRG